MKRLLTRSICRLSLVGCLFLCAASQALWLYQTQTWTLDPALPSATDHLFSNDGAEVIKFDVFSDLAYLPYFRRVEIEITGWYEGTASVTNEDANPAEVLLELSGEQKLWLNDTTGSPIATLLPESQQTVTVPTGGPHSFPMTATSTGSTVYLQPNTTDFQGSPGTEVDLILELYKHTFQATSLDGKQISDNYNGNVFATVELRYYVPEPSAGLILGLGLLVFIRRRSRRR